jgi:hypothetical protein
MAQKKDSTIVTYVKNLHAFLLYDSNDNGY